MEQKEKINSLLDEFINDCLLRCNKDGLENTIQFWYNAKFGEDHSGKSVVIRDMLLQCFKERFEK